MQKHHTKILLVICVLSALLRMGAALYLGNEVVALPGTFDQVSYHNLALRLLGGHGFTFDKNWWPMTAAGSPTAHWSYLYTGYLVLMYALFDAQAVIARLVQALIVGIVQPYLMYLLGTRLFGSTVGLIAAGVNALYTYFIYYAATLMTEPFYITGLLVVLLLATRLADEENNRKTLWLAAGLGLSLGMTVLLRQLFLLVVPFIFLWLWWAHYRKKSSWPVGSTLLALGILVLMIVPITLFNYRQFGRFVLINTNAGFAFYWGNHPAYGTHFIPARQMDDYQSLIPEDLRHLDEAALDQALLKLSMEFILDDPGRYLLLSFNRIPEYFRFWPSPESGLISNVARVTSFGLAFPFMIFGAALWVWRGRKQPWLEKLQSPAALLLIFALVYTGIHILTWPLIRYRLPVDAVMLPFASLALLEIFQWLDRKWHLTAALKPRDTWQGGPAGSDG